ncbi:MAG: 30S ribosome-binding factor RbfA [Oscillospiraceae bacterium]|nr:30S ribosome-binding factor RbfA [Oscillospiraceae bacterium]
MGKHRADRLSVEIQKLIADIIAKEVSDPRLSFVSVLKVDAAKDFSSARVYFSNMGQVSDKDVLAALDKAKGYIRLQLGRMLQGRAVPELIFSLDNSIAYGVKMVELISKQIEQDEANVHKSGGNDESSRES